MNINKCESELMRNPCNDISNQLKLHEIVTPKNILNSPNKTDNLQNFYNTSCKDENINSPQNGKNIFLLENIFENSMFKEQENSLQTAEAIQMNSQRKETISTSSDYDMFKSELNNMENFNEFEVTDLLPDLNSVVHFEDTKISDILSLIDTNIVLQETDDSLTDVNKDPATDPLFISDCEEKDNTTLVNSNSQSVQERSNYLDDKQISNVNNSFTKSEHKLSKEEKHILKELKNVEEEEDLPLPLINKLCSLRIKFIHKVPPQHKIEHTGSHVPTRRERKLFERYGPLRKGLYTPMEDKTIIKNWKTFCQLHDWDTKIVTPFLKWRHDKKYYIDNVKERQKFVQFLANGLPWRTLYSVHSRFKVLYCKKITYARYTSKEDEKILMYIRNEELNKRNTKYIELAKLLKRTRRSIIKRYQYLKKIETNSEIEPSNIRWTLPLIKKFIKTLLNVTISEDIRELKDARIPKPVWQKMEEKLNIHENILKSFWQHQLHLQLFSPNPIYLNDIKIQLIEYMYEKGISNTREIIWPNVAKHLDGTTAVFLCKVFFYLVQKCNMNDVENFTDIVEYLYHTKIPEIKAALTDKFLPRILYKNGKIYLLNAKDNDNTITTNIDN